MRNSLTKALLEHLAEHGKMVIDAFFPRNRPGTKLARELFGLDSGRYKIASSKKEIISSLLSRLRKDGLVVRTGSRKKSSWVITKKGINILNTEENLGRYILPRFDGCVRLITFDVPEKLRKKRNWLRGQLLACGFEQLHKSVWLGRRPFPEEFLKDLSDRNLTSFVHIVSVDKKGTLHSLPDKPKFNIG